MTAIGILDLVAKTNQLSPPLGTDHDFNLSMPVGLVDADGGSGLFVGGMG